MCNVMGRVGKEREKCDSAPLRPYVSNFESNPSNRIRRGTPRFEISNRIRNFESKPDSDSKLESDSMLRIERYRVLFQISRLCKVNSTLIRSRYSILYCDYSTSSSTVVYLSSSNRIRFRIRFEGFEDHSRFEISNRRFEASNRGFEISKPFRNFESDSKLETYERGSLIN